jgi:hypothetical protein
MSKYDTAQAAYLYLLENPEKSAPYAIAAVLVDARWRVATGCEMPDDLAEIAAVDDGVCVRHDVPPDVATAAEVLRDGIAAAAAVLRCSRRRVQQLLAREPLALAQRLAAPFRQVELFGEDLECQ